MLKHLLFTKKLTRRIFILTVLLTLVMLFPGFASAGLTNEKVLEITPVTDGLILEKREGLINGQQVLIYILRADLSNKYLKVDTLLGSGNSMEKNSTVTKMAVNNGAVAAVNADFFQMSESGRPIGMTFKNGEMVTSPPLRSDMGGWAITKDGTPVIQVFDFQGTVTAPNGAVFAISGVNKPFYYQSGGQSSHDNTILMYNSYWGNNSRGKTSESDNVVEVFVSGGIVTEILENAPGKPIPVDGYVLAGRGEGANYIKENINVGDELIVDYKISPNDIYTGTGGWTFLVDNGQALKSFPSDINGVNARTAVGYSGNKRFFYVVVVEKSPLSRGMTLNELANYMEGMGVERALNLDGGGSSTLAARPLGDERAVLVNRPSGTSQRSVPTGIGFFSTAPPGELIGIRISCPNQMFPGDVIEVGLKGYDSYYNPYPVVPDNAVFTIESGPGSIKDRVFTSAYTGLTTITANLNGIKTSKTIRILGSGDLKKITATPASLSLEPGQTAELKVIAIDNNDIEYLLNANNYTYTVTPGIGSFKNGLFEASQEPGEGEIKIVMGDYSVTVPVKISLKGVSTVNFVPGKPATLTLDEMSLKLPAGAFDKNVKITASVEEGLTVVPDRYSVISVINLNTGEETHSLNEHADLRWEFKEDVSGNPVILQLLDGKWQQVPSRYDKENKIVVGSLWEIANIALVVDKASPVSFIDMKGHWSLDAVSKLATAGVISGYPGNKFEPDRKINRSEFVVLLSKAMGWQSMQGKADFKDNGNIPSWAQGYVLAAYKRGIVSGYEDNTFRPDKQVTRAEMAVMIANALSLPESENIKATQVFVDGKTIPYWAQSQVSSVFAAGIMKGDSEKKFRPDDKATRAESAAMLDNLINYLLK